MGYYTQLFDRYRLRVGQVLLTADNIADRTAYVNAQNALATLFGLPRIHQVMGRAPA
jgi:glutamate 5-kinase